MASGFRRKRENNEEYVFIDGKAMRAEEAVRIDLGDMSVPGQEEAAAKKGSQAQLGASAEAPARADARSKRPSKNAAALRDMQESDALELRDEVLDGGLSLERTTLLLEQERRSMRLRYTAFGVALAVLAVFSLCLSSQHPGQVKSLPDTFGSIATWVQLGFAYIFDNASYHVRYLEATHDNPYFSDTVLQVQIVFKYLACGALLALSGMLYQNAFKNPIAAPSMLGVTNGINVALLVLVLQFGYEAYQHMDCYYIYSIIGGVGVLLLVMLGGKWISGKGKFNTVNMILMGTIVSQVLGVITQYIRANFLDELQIEAFSLLQNATGELGPWMYGTLIVGGLAAVVPIVLFRFKLNLISFSDEETKLLGVDPTKLRILALSCGSIMILVGTLNSGQVAMISLVVPFVVRAVFGSEFRKQLVGNLLVGALVLLVCGDLSTTIMFDGFSIGMAPVVSIVIMPLFVWMMAIRQRAWE